MSDNENNDGIVFGDWKLFPVDARNWELCHRHANTRGDNKGVVQWNRLGRFYQFNTFDLALQYAADCELKAKAHGRQMEIEDALHQYRAIVDALKADVQGVAKEINISARSVLETARLRAEWAGAKVARPSKLLEG